MRTRKGIGTKLTQFVHETGFSKMYQYNDALDELQNDPKYTQVNNRSLSNLSFFPYLFAYPKESSSYNNILVRGERPSPY